MPLLTDEAKKLSNDMLRAGVIENIITSDELFALLPFLPVDGKAYVYNREKTLGTADFTDTDDPITESAATFDKITAYLKRIIGDVDIDDFLEATMSDTTDQAAAQIAVKAKTVGRKYANSLVNGDENADPKQFDGLIRLVTTVIAAAQRFEVDPNGAALGFDHLDRLIDLVKIGGQRVFIMNSRTMRSFIGLVRGLGGVTAESLQLPGIGAPLPAYRGIPILKNDFVPIDQVQGNENAATTVVLAALDEDEGLSGLMSSNAMGIQVKEVGPVQNKDATRHRVRWYCGFALHSELAFAGAIGINN